jgi:hypothetical protein
MVSAAHSLLWKMPACVRSQYKYIIVCIRHGRNEKCIILERFDVLRAVKMSPFSALKRETVCFSETLVSTSPHDVITQKNIDSEE